MPPKTPRKTAKNTLSRTCSDKTFVQMRLELNATRRLTYATTPTTSTWSIGNTVLIHAKQLKNNNWKITLNQHFLNVLGR